MHDGTIEDGRLAACWGCGVEHYTLEPAPFREGDWRDLCDQCMPEYEEGVALGRVAIKERRSDFERRSMSHGPKRSGYMAGRFLQSAEQARAARRASA